ncbi:33 kDa inner dynein arm light chain, axonemal-like [Sipha flava]|uniref:Inner dynein arm light chain, axonemal n=1 Tax=Sipha flava TaxID=143950 RepID=A0A2S2QM87_9HEMI|nr:33 kDa inner dynein arm light chain, axonemal-like [Sipha flava]
MKMDSVEEVELPANINLIRFEKPELVTHKMQYKQEKCTDSNVSTLNFEEDVNINQGLKCDDVLNQILPAKEWEKDGKLYRQKLSNQPGTKLDMKNLNMKLNMYLKQFNAKEVGICPIKEQLYFQCFNEIIRQVTVNCPERGSMLIRVRDEIQKNLNSYQKLYESVITFGIRKSLLQKGQMNNLKTIRENLKTENEKLEAAFDKTIAKTEQLKIEMAKAVNAEETRHAKDLDDLKKSNQIMKVQIESIIDPKNYANK